MTPPSAPKPVEMMSAAAEREPVARPEPDVDRIKSVAHRDAILEITAASGNRMTLRMPAGSFNMFDSDHFVLARDKTVPSLDKKAISKLVT